MKLECRWEENEETEMRERTRFLTQDEIRALLKECEKQVTSPLSRPSRFGTRDK